MKPSNTLILSFVFFFGCDGPRRDIVPQPYPDFDSAIEAIATSEDIGEANAAAVQLYSGGVPAIEALRRHLSDQRLIPSGFCSRALNTYVGLTMAEQSRWTIQEMIETSLPKVCDDSYYVLRNGNLEQWLDERKGMSIIELRIEAARAQLHRAQQQMATGDPDAKGAIEMIENRLMELSHTDQD